MPERNAAERGIVLVLVLWAITVLAVIAGTFSAGARTQMGLAHNAVANAEAEALADAGIYRAIDGLLNAPEEAAPRTDGTVYAWSFGGGDVRYSVTDETGKIDVNLASADLLARLFEAAGEAPDASRAIAAAVVDYRDGDDEPSPGGAEDRDYGDAGFGEAKDAPFEMIEELTNVIGMTPALYRRIAPYVTVHADDGVPDASVAPPLVRLILERPEAPGAMQDDAGNEVEGSVLVTVAGVLADDENPVSGHDRDVVGVGDAIEVAGVRGVAVDGPTFSRSTVGSSPAASASLPRSFAARTIASWSLTRLSIICSAFGMLSSSWIWARLTNSLYVPGASSPRVRMRSAMSSRASHCSRYCSSNMLCSVWNIGPRTFQ